MRSPGDARPAGGGRGAPPSPGSSLTALRPLHPPPAPRCGSPSVCEARTPQLAGAGGGGQVLVAPGGRRSRPGCRPAPIPLGPVRRIAANAPAPHLEDLGCSHVTTEARWRGPMRAIPRRSLHGPRTPFPDRSSQQPGDSRDSQGLANQAQPSGIAWETPGGAPGLRRAQDGGVEETTPNWNVTPPFVPAPNPDLFRAMFSLYPSVYRKTSLSAVPEGSTVSKPRRGQRTYLLSTYHMEGSVGSC